MTDQSKIPLPPEGHEPAGKSLFERATQRFDLGSLNPATMPDRLAPPPARRLRPRAEPAEPVTQVAAPVPPSEAVAQSAVPSAVEAQPPETLAEPAAEPLRFEGERHPVDRNWLREQGLVVPEGPVTALLEEFRIVKRQVLQAIRGVSSGKAGSRAQRILVCSPHPGEGKTFCAVNLALSIAAERDCEVLLVDADFAKPSILSRLKLPAGPGLMDVLSDPALPVERCVIGTDIAGLWVLPAGNRTSADSEYLASSRAAELFDRLTQGAPNRVVIFDSPPALAASPAGELAKHVGQALLVARADTTGQSALEDAVSLLSACPEIKLLLNAARFSPSGRSFGTYYGYGD